jgi:hypothetical protein
MEDSMTFGIAPIKSVEFDVITITDILSDKKKDECNQRFHHEPSVVKHASADINLLCAEEVSDKTKIMPERKRRRLV